MFLPPTPTPVKIPCAIIPAMQPERRRGRNQDGFNATHFTRSSEIRLLAAFFLLLAGVGGALIWLFYGANAAYLGWGCMAVFGFFFALVWGIMSLISWWANKDENKLD